MMSAYELGDNISVHFNVGSRKHSRGHFTFKIEKIENGSFVASVTHEQNTKVQDDTGALYYVVAVILIYGCSILMMIASYIRKNNSDRGLGRYLKEMAYVRKRETQMQLLAATAKAVNLSSKRNVDEDQLPGSSGRKLSSVSETSHEFYRSDLGQEWESKTQYHLLTPTPSPGRTPGNSPSSLSTSPVFTDFPKQHGSKPKKKNPHVVKWICETDTETESEVENRYLLTSSRSLNVSPQEYLSASQFQIVSPQSNRRIQNERPSVIVTPSNSPELVRSSHRSKCLPNSPSVSSREEENNWSNRSSLSLKGGNNEQTLTTHTSTLGITNIVPNCNIRISSV